LIPWITTISVPQIEGFRDHYPQVNDLTWSGRFLDRRFLISIEKAEWDSVTSYVHSHLTDSVIEDAVNRMPEEWVAQEGERLIHMLKMRRNKLAEFSEEYYQMISKYVSIYASDKREFAEINRLDNEHVEVAIYKKDKETGEKKGESFFHRTFNCEETKEIRIELLDGDDTAIISGKVDQSITVLVIGGKGKDTLIDNSLVRGYFLSVTPISSAETKAILYDSGKKTKFEPGPSSKLNTDKAPKLKPYNPETDNVHPKYEPQIEDRGHDWKAGFWLGYNSNDGLLIGGGPILYEFGYRTKPFVYRMSLLLAYITNIETFVLDYKSEFYELIKHIKTDIDFRKITGNTFFYGYGNETSRDQNLEDADFYRIRPDLLDFTMKFNFSLNAKSTIWIGASYDNSQVKFDAGTILDSLQLDNTGKRSQIGLHVGYTLDTRDHELAPLKGVYIDFVSMNYPSLVNTDNQYHKMNLDLRGYLYSEFLTESSLAFRALGQIAWDNYPLHMTPFLGGPQNLRGFERQRFAGDALTYGAIELRSYLFPLRILVPARLGFSAFTETGRVFVRGEDSNKWYPSYGGGLWLIFLNRMLTLNLSFAQSHEGLTTYITTNFMF
jgi:hypothetical protein